MSFLTKQSKNKCETLKGGPTVYLENGGGGQGDYLVLLPWYLPPGPVVLKLYKHAEPLRNFLSFCRTPLLPNTTGSKNGLLKSDDLRRTPEMTLSNPV